MAIARVIRSLVYWCLMVLECSGVEGRGDQVKMEEKIMRGSAVALEMSHFRGNLKWEVL